MNVFWTAEDYTLRRGYGQRSSNVHAQLFQWRPDRPMPRVTGVRGACVPPGARPAAHTLPFWGAGRVSKRPDPAKRVSGQITLFQLKSTAVHSHLSVMRRLSWLTLLPR